MRQFANFIASTLCWVALWQTCSSLNNGLALTPSIGWIFTNSSESSIKKLTDAIVSQGYKDVGYEYLILNSDWYEKPKITPNDQPQPDRKRFPSGIKTLADYVHSKGLKFGLSIDAREAFQFETNFQQDVMKKFTHTLSEWGIDYVRVNDHQAGDKVSLQYYLNFGKFLNETGKGILYACDWYQWFESSSVLINHETIISTCNSWKSMFVSRYILDSSRPVVMATAFALYQDALQPNKAPGHWNTPDYFHLQDDWYNTEQSKKQMALWAILAAPLIMNTTSLNIKSDIKSIIQNKRVISVNQDALGISGHRILRENGFETWTRPITPVINGYKSLAILFINCNNDTTPLSYSVSLSKLGLEHPAGYEFVNLYDNSTPFHLSPNQHFNVTLSSNAAAFFKATSTL